MHDGLGIWLCARRLHKGSFTWVPSQAGIDQLTYEMAILKRWKLAGRSEQLQGEQRHLPDRSVCAPVSLAFRVRRSRSHRQPMTRCSAPGETMGMRRKSVGMVYFDLAFAFRASTSFFASSSSTRNFSMSCLSFAK